MALQAYAGDPAFNTILAETIRQCDGGKTPEAFRKAAQRAIGFRQILEEELTVTVPAEASAEAVAEEETTRPAARAKRPAAE